MAWTDQCKITFLSTARHLYYTSKTGPKDKLTKRKLKDVLRTMSKESGIPIKTLERWWYEGKSK